MSERKLSVLVATLRYPPYVAGGYELLTRDAVVALRERGHRVTVLAGKGTRHEPGVLPWFEPDLDHPLDPFERSFRASNFERLRLHFHRPGNARATVRALEASAADVLLFFNLGLVSLAPIAAARGQKIPTLGFLSDPWAANHWVLAWRESARSRQKRLRQRLLAAAWAWHRDRVGLGPLFTCSEYLRTRLVDEGLAAASMEVLHLGVPPDLAQAAETAQPPERAVGEPLRLLCVSSLWEGKGQDVLLEAARLARRAGVELEVTLAAGSGTPGYRARLEALAASEELGGRVHWAADLSRADLARLFPSMHVLVVPSVWGEPFPLATLEGMVHGLAVIVSDAGGCPEALEDGREGRVVPAGDAAALAVALQELDRDETARRALGRAARERARGALSHRAFMDRLEARLFEVVGER